MKFSLRFLLFTIVSQLVFMSCDQQSARPSLSPQKLAVSALDPHSFSNAKEAKASHLSLNLIVDFEAHILRGTATWAIEPTKASMIIFDTDGLQISKVITRAGDITKEVEFTLGMDDPILGQGLQIPLEEGVTEVSISYETSPEAEALQWMSPELSGTDLPFLFSQGQAILTRSWIPIQDSPGNRITYEAKLQVPKGMMAVMSADNVQERSPLGLYQFRMAQPIPPYLMAIAVGDLDFVKIGERTGVYAAPSVAAFAAEEFSQVDAMLEAAERLYGAYPWGRYDILVLPASFPFGGMENPKLTFATPTILVGDKSLSSLIAHELAHSWSGNLVTNATWDDFWINEGVTTYIERRIMEEISGRDYADMLLTLGRQDLADDLADLDAKDQQLRLNLAGRNPDDGMTDIAYEKGSLLMQTLEAAVGRAAFDAYLKEYFKAFQFKSITTDDWIDFTSTHLLIPTQTDIDLSSWIDQPGIPDHAFQVASSSRFDTVDLYRSRHLAEDYPSDYSVRNWTTNEWLYFIRGIPVDAYHSRLRYMDEQFHFSESKNAEIAAAWYELAIRNGYAQDIMPQIEAFLIRVGRRKFLTPLYRAMKERGMLAQARAIYAKARPGYHPVTKSTIDDLLEQSQQLR